jgi:hypothetical protein
MLPSSLALIKEEGREVRMLAEKGPSRKSVDIIPTDHRSCQGEWAAAPIFLKIAAFQGR